MVRNDAAYLFASERSAGVLVVFELDHGVTLLEAFKMMHKGIFAGSPVFPIPRAVKA
jgi:hypothetical protein